MEEIFQTFLSASSDDLKRAIATLKELSPLPMNSMLQRESKTDAVKKKTDRSKRVVEDVPPTTPGKKAHIQLFHLFWGKGLAWETRSSMLYRDFNETFPSLPRLPAEGIVDWRCQRKNVNNCVKVLLDFPFSRGDPYRKTPIF